MQHTFPWRQKVCSTHSAVLLVRKHSTHFGVLLPDSRVSVAEKNLATWTEPFPQSRTLLLICGNFRCRMGTSCPWPEAFLVDGNFCSSPDQSTANQPRTAAAANRLEESTDRLTSTSSAVLPPITAVDPPGSAAVILHSGWCRPSTDFVGTDLARTVREPCVRKVGSSNRSLAYACRSIRASSARTGGRFHQRASIVSRTASHFRAGLHSFAQRPAIPRRQSFSRAPAPLFAPPLDFLRRPPFLRAVAHFSALRPVLSRKPPIFRAHLCFSAPLTIFLRRR